MNKFTFNQIIECYCFVIAAFISGYCQNGSFNNLYVSNTANIVGSDFNHKLTVFNSATDNFTGGYGPVYARTSGEPTSAGGSSFGFLGVYSVIRGEVYYANSYSVAVSAHSALDNSNSASIVAAKTDGSNLALLSYRDGTSNYWPAYFVPDGANALKYGIAIRNPNGIDAGGSATGILFSVEQEYEFGKGAIVYERQGSWGRGSFHFLQEPSANTNNPGLANKVMTIANSGYVGIGTISPQAQLDVNGAFRLGIGASAGGTAYAIALTRTAGAMLAGANGTLTLGGDDNGVDMTILSNGNVGIGTTNPVARLEVVGKVRVTDTLQALALRINNWTLEAPDYVFGNRSQPIC
jgi:hypothetical protein